MRNVLLLTSVSVLFATGVSLAQATALEKLKGTWVIDYDRTLAYMKESPKYTPEEGERLSDQLKMLRGLMKIQITGSQVITARGDRRQALRYTPGEIGTDKAVLLATARGQEVRLTFTLFPGGVMNMRSGGTDDMDYFIWKKAR